ncbi:MAG: hypothetical protein A3G92_07485 [Deltaproteobacteria bacterium RIFCSPLOWO2_12_FULL_38_8]|nr:MAG: hypothetical protein A3G92_07485 [Deltaproteobacteria bacterium RIFCSPLOWO2_12_FULL_38_8]
MISYRSQHIKGLIETSFFIRSSNNLLTILFLFIQKTVFQFSHHSFIISIIQVYKKSLFYHFMKESKDD